MASRQQSISAQVCILGGGPHGLAAAVHLLEADPTCRIVTVDPAGAWLDGWCRQFACAEISTLRSPIVHHPAPWAMALRDHIALEELPTSGLPYDPPTTDGFEDFCRRLIDEMELENPLAGRAVGVSRNGEGITVELDIGTVTADHLVVATNPHSRNIPEWAWALLGTTPGAVAFGADVDLRCADVEGQQVAVIGGGMTAAHLAYGAASQGADVHLVSRRPLECRSFDTDPGWLGPKYLAAFEDEADPMTRLNQALTARGGGTIPDWMLARLNQMIGHDRLTIHDGAGVRAAQVLADGRCQLVLGDHTTLNPDRVWLATGTRPDIGALRYLEDLVADLPVLFGYPVTGPDLRLGPHPVYVMGRMATLALGPAAGNLWGAQRASERITAAVLGPQTGQEAGDGGR